VSAIVALEPPPPSLTDSAVASLHQAILATRLPPGETVRETAAATLTRLGKAPVRAALTRLADEELVQPLPRRGQRPAMSMPRRWSGSMP
jgi:DNA-binding GntR family transcriptional regulator